MIEMRRVALINSIRNRRKSNDLFYVEKGILRAVLALGMLSVVSCSPSRYMEPQVGALKQEGTLELAHSDRVHRKGINGYWVRRQAILEVPSHGLSSHSLCNRVNDHFMQCLLYDTGSDSGSKKASIGGVEYIISEALFNTLSEEERNGWSLHDSRILSQRSDRNRRPMQDDHGRREESAESYAKVWPVHNGMLEKKDETFSVERRQDVDLFGQLGHAGAILEQNRKQLVTIHNQVFRSLESGRLAHWQRRDEHLLREMASRRAHQRIHNELGQDDQPLIERGSATGGGVVHR